METVVANLSGRVRREVLNGRKYLVANATLIVPGVLPGSKGPLLYTAEELAKNPGAWNGMPLVGYHPTDNGSPVSARSPKVLAKHGIGFVFEAGFSDKLAAETWFDEELTANFDRTLSADKRVLPRLERGEPIELSTGLFTKNEPPPGVTANGTAYDAEARNHVPDHVAVLPDQVGACSVHQGCGIHVNSDEKKTLLRKLGEMLGLATNASPTTNPYAHEHAARVESPDKFKKDSFRRKEIAPGVSIIIARKPGGDTTETQAYRFDAEKFTAAEARAWLKKHKIEATLEAASGATTNAGPNEPSHSDLRQRLAEMIEKRFGSGGMGMMPSAYVVDVFDKEIVYEAQGKTWRLGYTSDLRTGAVELAQDAPEEVRRTTVYKPVVNATIPDVAWCPNCGAEIDDIDADGAVCPKCGESWDLEELTDNKGGDMKLTDNQRKETVDFIVTNCDCWKGQAEALGKLPDDQLVRIKTDTEKAKELEATVNAVRKEWTDTTHNLTGSWNAEKQVWEIKPKAPVVPVPAPTDNTARLTPEEQEDLAFARAEKTRQKQSLVDRLVGNVADEQARANHRAKLMTRPLAELQELASLLPAPAPTQNQGGPLPNWSGAAPAVNAAPDDSANLLPVFASDLDELASPALRRKRA